MPQPRHTPATPHGIEVVTDGRVLVFPTMQAHDLWALSGQATWTACRIATAREIAAAGNSPFKLY